MGPGRRGHLQDLHRCRSPATRWLHQPCGSAGPRRTHGRGGWTRPKSSRWMSLIISNGSEKCVLYVFSPPIFNGFSRLFPQMGSVGFAYQTYMTRIARTRTTTSTATIWGPDRPREPRRPARPSSEAGGPVGGIIYKNHGKGEVISWF